MSLLGVESVCGAGQDVGGVMLEGKIIFNRGHVLGMQDVTQKMRVGMRCFPNFLHGLEFG